MKNALAGIAIAVYSTTSFAVTVESISSVKERIKQFAAENTTDQIPDIFDYGKPQKPNFEFVRDEVANILFEWKLTGQIAFRYICYLLTSRADSKSIYGPKIRERLSSFQMDPSQDREVLNILDSNILPLDEQDVEMTDFGDDSSRFLNPFKVFSFVFEAARSFPSRMKALEGAGRLSKLILYGIKPWDCYFRDPHCMWESSKGLVNYFGHLVRNNQEAFLDALKFYTMLRIWQKESPHNGDFSVFDRSGVDIWPQVLNFFGNDELRALRALSIYGHDQCCNKIDESGELGPFLKLLNIISPTANHGDWPQSIIHAPGALSGIGISQKLLQRYQELSDRHFAIYGKRPLYRNGYYHVIGGIISGLYLLRGGYGYSDGFKLSSFLAQSFGYAYKKFTSRRWGTEDAKYLWKSVRYNEMVKPPKPKHWDQIRYEKALLSFDEVMAAIDLKAEQHKQGADFVYKIFLDLSQNKYLVQ